jgi:HK97 family phage portal protein
MSMTWSRSPAPWTVGRVSTGAPSLRFAPPDGTNAMVGPFVWDATSARQIPAVARCLQIYSGLVRQMKLDAYRGDVKLPRPRLLERPDPLNAGSWFVGVSIEDYLLSGNAVSLITSRGVDGWPLSVQYLPINYVYIVWVPGQAIPDYYFYGSPLPTEDVIHVKRGADRWFGAVRGVGIVEEAMGTLDRVAMEEVYEAATLAGSAVPSVAIIAPTAALTQDVADEAAASWEVKYGGPNRRPAILPNGTQVIPLAWSPSDTQLIEARHMSLLDTANLFNLDGYWLGAPVAGMTYKTATPQYQQVLRTSLEPVLADFEDIWSYAWLPRGQAIRFDRNQLLSDDLTVTSTAAVALYAGKVTTLDESRELMNLPPTDEDTGPPAPPPPVVVTPPAAAPPDKPAPEELPAA